MHCKAVEGRYSCGEGGERECVDGYHGEECNVFCEERDDDGGHYSCGPHGAIVCLPGWTQPGNNCTASKY